MIERSVTFNYPHWPGALLVFWHRPSSFTADAQIPSYRKTATISAAEGFEGTGSVVLWADEEGEVAGYWTVREPSTEEHDFTIPAGDGSPISLSVLLAAGVDPATAQGASVLAYIAGELPTWRGAWSAVTAYVRNDFVSRLGASYRAIQANTNQAPETNADDWELVASKGDTGAQGDQGDYGDQGEQGIQGAPGAANDTYDLATFVTARPDASEVILRFVAVRASTLPVGLTGSALKAADAATAQAVFSVEKNAVQFGTLTVAASGTTATPASGAGATLAAGDVVTIVAPASQDATLADFAVTLKGATV